MIGAEGARMVTGDGIHSARYRCASFCIFYFRVAGLPHFPPTEFGHRDAVPVLIAPRVLTGPEFPIPHL